MNMEWKRIKRNYGSDPLFLYLNKLRIAAVSWDLGHSKNSPNTHRADVYLPGMKQEFSTSTHPSEQIAKDAVETIVKRWVDAAGLEFK